MNYCQELKKVLYAFDDYLWHGASKRPVLDGLLEKHGFDLSEPIGALDIVSGFCKRYSLDFYYDKKEKMCVRGKDGKQATHKLD